jgi:inner membrane protein
MSQTSDGSLWLTDLRMGQEPHYSFQFNVGPTLGPDDTPRRATQESMRIDLRTGLAWLWQRALGHDVPPPGATNFTHHPMEPMP